VPFMKKICKAHFKRFKKNPSLRGGV